MEFSWLTYIYILVREMTISWTLLYYEIFYSGVLYARKDVTFLAIIYLVMKIFMFIYTFCTYITSICCCSKCQRNHSVGKWLGYLVYLLLFVRYFNFIYFPNQQVVIYIAMCVTIWVTHGSIIFTLLYKLTSKLIGG